MTVTITTTRSSFNGNGASFSSGGTPVGAGPHDISFKVIDASHFQVYWTKGTGTIGTPLASGDFTGTDSGYLVKDVHYTVQNAGTTSNATITWREAGWTVSSTVIYPTSNDVIVVTRNVPLTQVTNYQNNASIDAETIESSFDKLVQTTQQLDDGKDYSFKFASNISGTTGFDSNADTATTLNSDKSARASKALRFDSDGNVGISVHDPDEQATIATTQANSAILKASEAAVSASSASTSENNASASATSSSASAANAATSETNAFGYKNSAAASASSASASAIAMAIALGLILTPLLS